MGVAASLPSLVGLLVGRQTARQAAPAPVTTIAGGAHGLGFFPTWSQEVGQAMSFGDSGPTITQNERTPIAAPAESQATIPLAGAEAAPAEIRADVARGVWSWYDAAFVGGIIAGVLLLGLWGETLAASPTSGRLIVNRSSGRVVLAEDLERQAV